MKNTSGVVRMSAVLLTVLIVLSSSVTVYSAEPSAQTLELAPPFVDHAILQRQMAEKVDCLPASLIGALISPG